MTPAEMVGELVPHLAIEQREVEAGLEREHALMEANGARWLDAHVMRHTQAKQRLEADFWLSERRYRKLERRGRVLAKRA